VGRFKDSRIFGFDASTGHKSASIGAGAAYEIDGRVSLFIIFSQGETIYAESFHQKRVEKMSEHLSIEEIKSYLKRELPPAEIIKADDHLAQCDACLKKVKVSEFSESPADFDFLRTRHEESDHLQYEQLENYVDEKSDEVEREIADVHLKVCRDCRTELNGLIEMRNLIEADLQKKGLPAQSAKQSFSAAVRSFFFGNPFLKFGLAAIVLLILFSAIFLFSKRNSNLPEIVATSPSPSAVNLPIVSTATPPANIEINAPPGNNANLQNRPAVEDKKNELPSVHQTEIERVLAGNRLNLPAELNQLSRENGKLMSGGNETVPFALESPIGKIIQSERPRFRWRTLEGADGYIVNIYDSNFNRVAGSSQISRTNWQIDRPLPRNRTYIWQVTAIKDGAEIKSPMRPAPDAKFKVIDGGKANELARISRQYKNEHLALGILYANAGLLDEAEREFQKEIAKNPNSNQARKFLQDIRKLK
jgi:hypothetical protein